MIGGMKMQIKIDWEEAKTPTPFHPIPIDTQMYIKELESRFERIAKELEEYKYSHLVEIDREAIKHCEGVDDCVNVDCLLCVFDKAIEIVKGGVDNAE
jgi:hypothetical protein